MPRRKKTESRQALEFASILAVVGVAFGAVSLWRHHPARAGVFAGSGLAALALAVLARPAWMGLFRLWMKLAGGMGWVTTRVLLTIFYFAVLTPFGIVRKVSGHPTLDTDWRERRASYWIDKEPIEASIDRYAKRY